MKKMNVLFIRFSKEIKKVNCDILSRYEEKIEAIFDNNLIIKENILKIKDLIVIAIDRVDDFTIDKHSRWLGYIQGVLIENGILNVEEERENTRLLFQTIYKKYGITQETI
jgi:hypothetical protein